MPLDKSIQIKLVVMNSQIDSYFQVSSKFDERAIFKESKCIIIKGKCIEFKKK